MRLRVTPRFRGDETPKTYELERTELLGTEPIQDLIDLTIRSAYVENERINSLLIVSEPEAGKTELIKKFRENKGVYPRRRFTAYGIIKDLLDGQIKTLFNQCIMELAKGNEPSLENIIKKEHDKL